MRPFVLATLTGLALAACTESTRYAPAPAASPLPAPASPGPSPPAPTPPAPHAPTPPSAPTVTPPPAPPPGPTFHLLAFRDGDLDILQLGDEVFVQADTELARLDAQGALVFVATDLARSGRWGEALPDWSPGGVGGRWPDNAWMTLGYEQRSTNPHQIYRRDGDRWALQPNKRGLLRWSLSAVLAWHSGQVLGLREWEFDPALGFVMDESGLQVPRRLERAVARELAAARSGFVILGPRPTPTAMILPAKFVVHSLDAAPTGELFVLGRVERSIFDLDYQLVEADEDDENDDIDPAEYDHKGPFQVLRWDLAGEHTIDELPAGGWGYLAVRSADEAYIAGDAEILRFDGAAWTPSPAPASRLRDLTVAPSGALWAVTNDHSAILWQRPKHAAAWQPVPLPEQRFPDRALAEWACDPYRGCELAPGDPDAAARSWPVDAIAVRVPADDDIWVIGRTGLEREEVADHITSRTVVLRSRGPAGAPLRIPPEGDLIADASDRRRTRLDRQHNRKPHPCNDDTSFVALHTLPADAAPTGRDPVVDTFIRDHAALLPSIESIQELVIRGRRTVGVFVPPQPAETTRALLTALRRLVPDEPHLLDCIDGRVLRGFDRTTGAPIP